MTVDHIAQAIGRLPQSAREGENWIKLIGVLFGPVQDLEDAFQDLLLLRNVDTAEGAQLDAIGAKVGQPRGTVSDDDLYRRYIRARIYTNRSNGTVENLIRIAKLVIADSSARMVVTRENVATVKLRVDEIAVASDVADILIGFLRQAKLGGVRMLLETSEAVPASTFKWDTPGRGWDSGALWTDVQD